MNKTNKTSAGDLFELAKGAVMLGAAKARETAQGVIEAMKIDTGSILFDTYNGYIEQGWTHEKALKMTLDLAKSQLTAKIEESKSAGEREL